MDEPRRLCLITGASAGIGAAFARTFAARGYDVALTARRADRLQALAEDIRLRHGVEALVVPADLAEPGAVDAMLAAVAAQGRAVDALVNNAGYGLRGSYANGDWPALQTQLQVMLVSVCELTQKALAPMVERGFGRIVNVASLAGMIPGAAGATLYTPIKSFLIKFSQGLHLENLETGVHVSALCPGYTLSEFHDVNHSRQRLNQVLPKWMWLGADEVAAAGYEAVEANRPVCVPGAPNKAIAALAKIAPDEWLLALMAHEGGNLRPI